MEDLWGRLRTAEAALRSEFEGRNWSEVSSWQLLEWLDAAIGVHLGVEAFLPPRLDRLPLPVRRFLYVHVFLFAAGARLAENRAIRPIWYAAAAPFLTEEFERRAQQHMGAEAGVLLLIMGALRLTPANQSGLLERDATATVDRLTKIVGKMRVPPQDRPEIPGQIPITLGGRWGQLDPIESLARALEGELDIAPRAVRDDLVEQAIKALTGEKKRARFEVLFREHGEDQDIAEAEVTEKDVVPREEERRLLERLHIQERLRASPRMTRLVAAFLEEPGRQAELARRLEVTDRTLRSWMKELERILKE